MRTAAVAADTHRVDEYAIVFEGYRAVQLTDDAGRMHGEMVWRLATGNTVEITEFGIFDACDRRHGHGTRLLHDGLEDIRSFFIKKGLRLRLAYLFCDAINKAGRAFWEARGFRVSCILPDFYHYCDAVLYVRAIETAGPESHNGD